MLPFKSGDFLGIAVFANYGARAFLTSQTFDKRSDAAALINSPIGALFAGFVTTTFGLPHYGYTSYGQ
jgi:hypothetical protein